MNPSAIPLDDPRVLEAVREYQASLETGRHPDRRAFEARFPEVADALAGCFDALDFMRAAAPSLAADAVCGARIVVGVQATHDDEWRLRLRLQPGNTHHVRAIKLAELLDVARHDIG